MNACGTCTMCCKLMAVQEINKPKDARCPNCIARQGCAIYEQRPESCAGFSCIWLQTQKLEPARRMPLSQRPDKSKVMLHEPPVLHQGVVARVDPAYPMAWQEKEMAVMLTLLSQKLNVLVDVGKKYWLIEKGRAREVRMSEPDENGIETFMGYVDEHV